MEMMKIENLFLDPEESDLRIRVQTEQDGSEFEVPGHRLIIKLRSKVLKAMIDRDDFKEDRNKALELKVQGDKVVAFNFLRFLYMRDLNELDIQSYLALLHTAHTYEMHDLSLLCQKRIQDTVTPITVSKIYTAIGNIATEECRSFLFNLMLKSAFLIFEKDLHLSLREETMKLLLQSNQLNILDENQAIWALWSWGQANFSLSDKDNMKNMFAELVTLVRWSLVTNSGEDGRWSDLIPDGDDTSPTIKVPRSPDPTISLLRFAKLVKVVKELAFTNNQSVQPLLIKFSCTKSIFLVGLSIQLDVNFQKTFPFWLTINTRDFVPSIHKEIVIESKNLQNTKKVYSHEILLQIDRPILVKEREINTIAISYYPYNLKITAPVYSPDTFTDGTSSFPEIGITSYDNTYAIKEMFIFPK